jgi:hypothetical protein
MQEITNKILIGKPEVKRPLGRPRCRWENNIKLDLSKWDEKLLTSFFWLRLWISGDLF